MNPFDFEEWDVCVCGGGGIARVQDAFFAGSVAFFLRGFVLDFFSFTIVYYTAE